MAGRIEVRLSGSGGQGLILAGIILAEASINDGMNSVHTQSYGAQSRGGHSRSDVVISEGAIDFPHVAAADVLLTMSQEAAKVYAPLVKPEAVVVVDSTYVDAVVPPSGARVYRIPISRLARIELGKEMAANMVALGAMNALSHLVTPGSLRQAVLDRVPRGTQELNLRALDLGASAAREASSQVDTEARPRKSGALAGVMMTGASAGKIIT
ncbi:MAG: 2-oxoacid:acceptor oxidoreductase family protein [Firmicutes bacterium]|nr:2-oxoacid:acceptor oxidoreductase family protein [Bacillota bacterium]